MITFYNVYNEVYNEVIINDKVHKYFEKNYEFLFIVFTFYLLNPGDPFYVVVYKYRRFLVFHVGPHLLIGFYLRISENISNF